MATDKRHAYENMLPLIRLFTKGAISSLRCLMELMNSYWHVKSARAASSSIFFKHNKEFYFRSTKLNKIFDMHLPEENVLDAFSFASRMDLERKQAAWDSKIFHILHIYLGEWRWL